MGTVYTARKDTSYAFEFAERPASVKSYTPAREYDETMQVSIFDVDGKMQTVEEIVASEEVAKIVAGTGGGTGRRDYPWI